MIPGPLSFAVAAVSPPRADFVAGGNTSLRGGAGQGRLGCDGSCFCRAVHAGHVVAIGDVGLVILFANLLPEGCLQRGGSCPGGRENVAEVLAATGDEVAEDEGQ